MVNDRQNSPRAATVATVAAMDEAAACARSRRLATMWAAFALANALFVGMAAGCSTPESPSGPTCGDDLADINRDGRADEADCALKDAARAEKATCTLVDGLWWSQPKCASEATKELPSFATISPWDHVRALPNASIALLRPEGLTIVTPRTGTGGSTGFAQSAVIADFGDRISSVGTIDEIAMVASHTRAWYDRNNDATPSADEIVDISQLGSEWAWQVQVLRISGHAAAVSEVQGQLIAWQDLNDNLLVDANEVITITASRLLGATPSAIYFTLPDAAYAISTDPWSGDPSRIVTATISSDCQSLVPGAPGWTTLCTSETGRLLDAVDGHQLSGSTFATYRRERYLVGRQYVTPNVEGETWSWFDLDSDEVEQANERFVRKSGGTIAAFDATIDFRNQADPYSLQANGITMTYGPTGSADPLRIVAWRRSRARAFAGEPCNNAEQCPIGYTCEQNGTSSQPCCVVDLAAAP